MRKLQQDGVREWVKRIGDLFNRISLFIFEKVMTKVTILGKSQGEEPKKKIEFIKYFDIYLSPRKIEDTQKPDKWDNIVLLCKNHTNDGLDLMYAYDNNGFGRLLVLGHFNDGVV